MPSATSRPNPRNDARWVAARFDRVAWCYPLLEPLFLVPERARTTALDMLAIRPGDRVLSVGCGRGRSLPALAHAVGPGGEVVGIDLSQRMLRLAEERMKDREPHNIELKRADLLRFDEDGKFTGIYFEFSLSSFGDPQAAIAQAWKLLPPGGTLVVLDGRLPPRMSWLTKPMLPVIRWLLERTVLGDPDMDASKELIKTGLPHRVEWFRSGTYFSACLRKE